MTEGPQSGTARNVVPVLSSALCTLRPWKLTDIASLAVIANSRAVARNLTHFPHPFTEQDAIDWVTARLEPSPQQPRWAVESDGQLVGAIGLDLGEGAFHRSAELGYWIGEAFWGRGIATSAASLLVGWVFRETCVVRIQAHVFAWNPASARVLEKVGFTREGVLRKSVERFGEFSDRLVYATIMPTS